MTDCLIEGFLRWTILFTINRKTLNDGNRQCYQALDVLRAEESIALWTKSAHLLIYRATTHSEAALLRKWLSVVLQITAALGTLTA